MASLNPLKVSPYWLNQDKLQPQKSSPPKKTPHKEKSAKVALKASSKLGESIHKQNQNSPPTKNNR